VRHYAQKPPGGIPGGAGGFPGFNMFGQQQEKGDALKQYVSMTIFTILGESIKTLIA
jgi:ATP-dependent Clp protease ATP-binding subunit ClpB